MAHSLSGRLQPVLTAPLTLRGLFRLHRPVGVRGRRTDDPEFLHGGFAALTPDLTGEIRQALGWSAARRVGDAP